MSAEDRQFSATEAARELGVTEKTVRNWLRGGKLDATKAAGEWRIPESALAPFRRPSAGSPPEPSAPATSPTGTEGGSPPASERKSAGNGAEPEAVTGTELLRLVRDQQQTIMELAGRVGFLQAELQAAQTRLLALEAHGEPSLAVDAPQRAQDAILGVSAGGSAPEPAESRQRPWWRFWR